jgi:hypothetical protein
MRFLAPLLILSLSCELSLRPAADCRYLSIRVQSSSDAAAMSEQDQRLTARIAEFMEIDLARHGFQITAEEESAYLSLLVLAGEERQLEGFVFTALVAVRERRESHESGLDRYAAIGAEARPTFYHGLSWGPKDDLRESVRAFVQQADMALLPRVHEMCESDRLDREREATLERQMAEYLAPL